MEEYLRTASFKPILLVLMKRKEFIWSGLVYATVVRCKSQSKPGKLVIKEKLTLWMLDINLSISEERNGHKSKKISSMNIERTVRFGTYEISQKRLQLRQ